VVKAWTLAATLAFAVPLAGCDTSLGGFRFSCGPDAGCPTGQACQAGFCAAGGGTGSNGSSGASASSGGIASGSSGAGSRGGSTSASSGAGSSGGGTTGGASWAGGGTTGCNAAQGAYATLPSLGSDVPYAIAVDGTGDVLVLTLPSSDRPALFSIAPDGGVSSLAATVTGLAVPNSLAVDGHGTVFMLDDSGDVITLPNDGGAPTPLCTGSCFSGEVQDIAVGPDDTVYVTLSFCVMSLAAGTPAIVAGNCESAGYFNGTGTAAQFESLKGIAVDPGGGGLVVADGANGYYCLRHIDLGTGAVTDYGAPCKSQPFYTTESAGRPGGVAEDAAGNVFSTDLGPGGSNAGDIWEVTPAGAFIWLAGGGKSASATGSACGLDLTYPDGIAVDAHDNVFVLDQATTENIYELTP